MTGATTTWQSWNERLNDAGLAGAQAAVHRIDQATTTLRQCETRIVPGMLQTRAYAHAVFSKISALRGLPATDVASAVDARLERRTYLADPRRSFEFLVTESVLTEPAHGAAVQIEQVEALHAALDAPTIRFGILPADRPLSVVVEQSFALHDDRGVIEGYLGELHVGGDDAALLHHVMDTLWLEAIEGDRARDILQRALEGLRSTMPRPQ
jgi:hypothetical protein